MEQAGLHPLIKQATGTFEGITNDQVEDLWNQVQSSGRVSDKWPIHMEDAALANPAGWMQEQQTAVLRQGDSEDERRGSTATVGLTAQVAEPIDPLSRMALVRRQAAASKQAIPKASEAAPGVAPATRANPERFLEDQLGALHSSPSSSSGIAKKPSVMPERLKESLRIDVVSAKNLEGVTFYLIRVTDQGIALFFTKRYSQLKEFDEVIRPALSHIGEELAPFPSAGMMGIRHRVSQLGLSSFDDQRLQDLRLYLKGLASCFKTCRDVPVLEDFFSKDSPDRITPKGDRFAADEHV